MWSSCQDCSPTPPIMVKDKFEQYIYNYVYREMGSVLQARMANVTVRSINDMLTDEAIRAHAELLHSYIFILSLPALLI